MKIILDQIEFDLPEPIFKVVQGALQSGKVKKAIEISKNLWNFQIKFDDALVETELRFGKNQASKVVCACGRSNPRHPCIHAWIASYWYFWEIARRRKNKEKNPGNAKTVAELMNANPRELQAIVKLFCKLDKKNIDWASVLLTPAMRSPELYHYLQQKLSAFDPQQNKGSSYLSRLYREHIELGQMLYHNALEDYAEGNPEPAIIKLLVLSIRFSRWLQHYEKFNHTRLLLLLGNIHKAFEELLKSLKAPDLLEKVLELTVAELTEKEYPVFHHEENLYITLLHLKNNVVKSSSVKNLIFLNINSGRAIGFIPEQLLLLAVQSLTSKEWNKILLSSTVLNLTSPVWLRFLDKISELSMTAAHFGQIMTVYESLPYYEVRCKAADLLVTESIHHKNIEEARLLTRRFSLELSQPGMARSYFLLEEYAPEKIRSFIEDYKKLHSNASHEFILLLLEENELYELLVDELENEDNIEIIIKYDRHLFNQYSKKMLNKYLVLSGQFLNQFAGHQAYEYIDRIRKHISKYGTKAHNAEFSDHVQKLFPERTNLQNLS